MKKNAVPLVSDPHAIRLALAGKVEENDHPYSWSAILNGFNPEALDACPNSNIRRYLSARPKEDFGLSGVQVTHIWCENQEEAHRVARFSRIPKVVRQPEDLIGQVDAVIIPTDRGEEHAARARPFLEARLPVFIDKPLTDRWEDLLKFTQWHREGKAIMSSSCMRYAREFRMRRVLLNQVGEVRLITATTCKSWERYGIHAVEAAYPFLPAGNFLTVRNTGSREANIVHVRHACGVDLLLAAVQDMEGALGCLGIYGTKGCTSRLFQDYFSAFKMQLKAFVSYLRNGKLPFPFAETVELTKIIIAGITSREQGGRAVCLSEMQV